MPVQRPTSVTSVERKCLPIEATSAAGSANTEAAPNKLLWCHRGSVGTVISYALNGNQLHLLRTSWLQHYMCRDLRRFPLFSESLTIHWSFVSGYQNQRENLVCWCCPPGSYVSIPTHVAAVVYIHRHFSRNHAKYTSCVLLISGRAVFRFI